MVVNYLIGANPSGGNGAVSDKFSLGVTPPGMFFIIWAVIFTTQGIIVVMDLIRKEWHAMAHVAFSVNNILSIIWNVVFTLATLPAVCADVIVLFSMVVVTFTMWLYLRRDERDWAFYINRCVIAFYLGWLIAATNINFGINIVYWWGGSKLSQVAVFWVLAPLEAIGATAFNTWLEGKRGLLSCCTLWLSVGWAFVGAGITTHKFING